MKKNPVLAQLRLKIDKADDKVLKALRKRFEIVELIGKEKSKRGLAAYQKKRSLEVLENIAQKGADQGLEKSFVKALYQIVLRQAVKKQKQVISKKKSQPKAPRRKS